MPADLSALLGNLTAPPDQDPLLELERRLQGIRSGTLPQLEGQTQNVQGQGLASLLAPYDQAVQGAPTDFTGTSMDLMSMVKQVEGQQGKGGGGGWNPSFAGGTGKIITKNGIGMAAPAMRSLMQLKAALGVKPLANATGGWRSAAAQRRLYADHLAGRHPAPVAKPGTSLHEIGMAIDFNTGWITAPAQKDVRRWLLNNGWHLPMPSTEPWHYSYRQSG